MLQQTRIGAEALSVDVSKVEAKPPAGARVPQKWGRPGKLEGLGQPHRSRQPLGPEIAECAPPPRGEGGVRSKLSTRAWSATGPSGVDANPPLAVPRQLDLLHLSLGGNSKAADRRITGQ